MKRWYERLRSRTAALLHDILMIPAAWLLAFWTRFNFETIPDPYANSAIITLALVVPVCAVSYWQFGLYRGVWRFASLPDLTRIVQATLTATAAILALLFIVNRMDSIPRSVPLLFLLFQLVLLAGPRLLYRWIKDHRLTLSNGQRVLIIGAGRAGEMLVRDMLRDPHRTYQPVAFIDDRPRRDGGAIHGIPIHGNTARLSELVTVLSIDLILLAIPSASAPVMQRLVELCEQTQLPFRTVPQLHSLMSGQVTINQLREVSIEDLLGREPVTLDWDAIRAELAGRVILITGAGGSIGAELCRQIIPAGIKRLILVDHCELSLYRVDMELAETYPQLPRRRYLFNVADAIAMQRLFAHEQPSIVFHAAAYKHVPLLEDQIDAAVQNNIIGTYTVAHTAQCYRCERFILISTDKAVNPTNVMGASKRVAELCCQRLTRLPNSPTRFITVRFGNVLGSTGSVVPLFRRQIAQGGPVTVTDPEIERYFMTIPEACQLIMQAAATANGGEIFILDMGEPVKIRFLAEQMIRLSGRQPGSEIPIQYIGLRPGEKRFEELFYANENTMATAHPKIRVARPINSPPTFDPIAIIDELNTALAAHDVLQLTRLLKHLVPEWQPDVSHAFH
ncbi:polysaccharide biosynthesis protein [Thiospirillum jenense]|uniref:Polysaccharide biosynthesis protein n=1 Tax=Thiospirillum jenense TaxID=1653858 RepID=A0A839HCD0_9GAMM|nr:nucleoside-diphosphate sugar epimerase/dehydratase [Thiospirillum jenense]MBB1126194.1 polysaccharide biosynthesis protein [Thiospirillum jenense]